MGDWNHLLVMEIEWVDIDENFSEPWILQQNNCRYSWTNKKGFNYRIFYNVHRILDNNFQTDAFPNSEAVFLADKTFDHFPGVAMFL